MRYDVRPAFARSFKKKTLQVQQKARKAIDAILDYFNERIPLQPGLGLKHFRGRYWEIRLDIRDRIVFELTDRIVFWLVGNHDEVRRFMKDR